MRKLVFLKISAQNDAVDWLEVSKEGHRSGPMSAKSAEMKNKFVDTDIVLMVPGQEVLLTQVFLPKLSHSKMKQALIFALEEQLLEDSKNLHFCLGNHNSKQDLPVAVVNKQRMKNWVDVAKGFTNNNTNVVAIISESTLIPFDENTWSLWMEQDRIIIRTAKNLGFVCDPESLLDIIKLKLEQSSKKPEKIVVYAKNEHNAREILKTLDIPMDFITLDNQGLRLQFDEYKKHNYINLLQNEFKLVHELFSTEVTALIIAGLVGVWFGVLLLGNALKYVYLDHTVNKIDQQIAQNYKTLFPESTSVVTPRIRVQRLLSSMRTNQTKGAFLTLVARVGPIVKQEKGLVIQMVTYGDSKAQLDVDVPDFEILDNFTQGLQRAGLVVSHSNATKAGTTIQAKIDVRMAS